MFRGYTHEEAVRIITHYAALVRGIARIDTYATPQRTLLSGKAEDFFVLPFNVEQESYELFILSYQLAPVKSDWLQAKRREQLRWLPMVVIAGQSVPLVPVLAETHIWNDEWRL